MPIGKKLDTPESREFWRLAQQASEEVAQWPAWKRGVEKMVYSQPNVMDIAKYIIKQLPKQRVTRMRLMHLLYYCQAWSFVWNNQALFSDRIEAWVGGPVVPLLFNKWEDRYVITIKNTNGDIDKIDFEQRQIINQVLTYYKDMSNQELKDLICTEQPHLDARKGLSPTERGRNEITQEKMRSYYASAKKQKKSINPIIDFEQSITALKVTGDLQREWIKVDVAEQIAKALKAIGISKAELARRLGVSRAYITQIMRGDCNVSITKLADIATALGKRVKIEFIEEDR